MCVAVRDSYPGERLAAVNGPMHAQVHYVDRVLVQGIGGHGRVVPETDVERLVGVDPLPGVTGVIGAKNAA